VLVAVQVIIQLLCQVCWETVPIVGADTLQCLSDRILDFRSRQIVTRLIIDRNHSDSTLSHSDWLEITLPGQVIDRLRPLDPVSDTPYVVDTVRSAVEARDVRRIGFAGAPFTVASYLVEGGPSRHHARTKALMVGDAALWHELMDRLADLAIASLVSQVEAGAAAVQLFDSWAGVLSPGQYRRGVAPHSARVLETLGATGVPRIHFGVGTGELLDQMGDCGADVVGVDFRVSIDEARRRVGPGRALQGNLDPAMVLAGETAACEATRAVLAANGGHPGFVFNLGHGVLPASDPDVLARVVQVVHDEGRVRCEQPAERRGNDRPGGVGTTGRAVRE